MAIPHKPAEGARGGKKEEWHKRGNKIGLHLCSTAYRLFNHDPQPNCAVTTDGLIKTLSPIEPGEELTLNYNADPLRE